MILKLTIISILVFVINIPFGYWRANVRKFSLQWALAIHIPVPFIILLRIYSDIGFAWYTYLFLISAFFLGQRLGAYVLKGMSLRCSNTGSCLTMDLIRCYISRS
ncbi:MAG: hypothetical protein ABFR62_07145 [Bacteroidota bacterium]